MTLCLLQRLLNAMTLVMVNGRWTERKGGIPSPWCDFSFIHQGFHMGSYPLGDRPDHTLLILIIRFLSVQLCRVVLVLSAFQNNE
jgi:hypothetical protein